jgi:hypothetical protein
MLFFFACSLTLCTPVFEQQTDSGALERIGTILHPPIREASGLVASRNFPDVLWTITDSQGAAHLYAIERSGRLLADYEVRGAANVDWESIAIDDRGFLYIADVGNNLKLPVRWVYQIREPDPRSKTGRATSRPVQGVVEVEYIFPYTFPQQPLDVEGTFVLDDSMYLISKVKKDTAVYRLCIASPSAHGRNGEPEQPHGRNLPTARVAAPVTLPAQKLQELGPVRDASVVTGADLSPDGRRIAIVTYRAVAIYSVSQDIPTALRQTPATRIPFAIPAIEGCCWHGDDLLLVSENRGLYRVDRPVVPDLPTEPPD